MRENFVHKRTIIFFFSMLLCASSWAQDNNILSTVSPKLKKLISDYPEASKVFTNIISNTFSNKTVRLYYFYSDDESEERAFHYYPNTVGLPEIVLCARENQTPLDEFICILFETMNTKNESGFAKLFEAAHSGSVSREQFARDILQYEFEATKNIRTLLLTLKFGNKETIDSYYYSRLINCPNEFESFLEYSKKVSPHRDAFKNYELYYDSLRKTDNVSNSPASKN
jgi:hypothetical protein